MSMIRPIEEKDIDALLVMEQELFSMPWTRKDFQDQIEKDYNHCLVAEVDGQVVGCINMLLLCGEGSIEKVMVDKRNQGKHIGQELVGALFTLGEQLKTEAYTLEVRVSNTPALKLYQKMGFVEEGIRPGFYDKPKEDAVIMWKRLM